MGYSIIPIKPSFAKTAVNDWRLTTKGGSSLRTEKKFTSYEMFADFRDGGKAAPFELPNIGTLGEMKNLSKGWNRLRVTRQLGRVRLELNGKAVYDKLKENDGPLEPASIILVDNGLPTQFANIFVKELK